MLGGWRLSAIQIYSSGFPIGVTRNAPLPIFNGSNRPYITTYDWKTTYSGSFDPNKETYLNAAAFRRSRITCSVMQRGITRWCAASRV